MKHCLSIITAFIFSIAVYGQHDSFLFRTPLSFYNTDILSYLQVLHKNQQYEKMVPLFTGSALDEKSSSNMAAILADAPFGYSMKRAGILEVQPQKRWSITYSRNILGTQETFTIDCVLERDTYRVVLDEKSKTAIFKQ
jgi:hypothetical protein